MGALVGAIVAVEIYKRLRGVSGSTGGLFVGSFSLGVVVGRLGCFFAGLPDGTYGTPTGLPWAVDLGDGVGRHPVQLYESGAMALFLAVYLMGLRRRSLWAMRRGFYAMCLWYGVQRFVWELLKPYPTLIGPFNLFHVLCGGLVAYGWLYIKAAHVQNYLEQRALVQQAREISDFISIGSDGSATLNLPPRLSEAYNSVQSSRSRTGAFDPRIAATAARVRALLLSRGAGRVRSRTSGSPDSHP